jgi:hypothetical protein
MIAPNLMAVLRGIPHPRLLPRLQPEAFAALAAGADGFGIGPALYAPGMPVAEVTARAKIIVAAFDVARPDG